ncbi:MAG TPA: Rho termination factor N-terminal domain-containing protein, partial [Marmoricola sp.]
MTDTTTETAAAQNGAATPAEGSSATDENGRPENANGRTGASRGARGKGGLSGMLLPELRQIAGGLGIKSTGMKKADLVAAIKAAQGSSQGSG